MIIDLYELEDERDLAADLLTVGGGMAGIALAREWRRQGKSVAILESGGIELEKSTQDLYAGTAVMRGPGNPDLGMDDYLTYSRFRQFGGTGNAWNGKCVPLDPWDFEPRGWIEGSGWPISRRSLQPYYDGACDLMGIPRFDRDFARPQIPGRPPLALGRDRYFSTFPRYYSDRTGTFAGEAFDRYRFSIAESAEITVYLHANVSEIVLDAAGETVDHLKIRTLRGRRHRARGRVVVLAAGGIENARLLLASNGVQRSGIGNAHDLVGRFFQGHVRYDVFEREKGRRTAVYPTGERRPMALYTDRRRDRVHAVLGATLKAQKTFRTAGFAVDFFAPSDRAPSPQQAVLAAASAMDAGGAAYEEDARLPVSFHSEQSPNPESRIRLTDMRDALGMPRVRLEWTFSDADFDFLENAVAALTSELGARARGRVQFPVERGDFLDTLFPVHHHMGTTRMHEDPRHGVVDSDCRVHGVRNLYLAGSSVFPTSGTANPTLTILALALRLSDRLKTSFGRP